MSYITVGIFWPVIGILVLLIIGLWIKASHKPKTKPDIADGDSRTYGLGIVLEPSVIDKNPELKAIFDAHKKSSHDLLEKGGAVTLLFLASDCRWFVQDAENGYFVFPVFDRRNKILFKKQILGKNDPDTEKKSGKEASFMVTERTTKEKGHLLSIDIVVEDYGKDRILPKSKERMHLGELPIPKYYDGWGDAGFERLEQFGWKEDRREFNWAELEDDFGEHENVLDPLRYKNGNVTVTFLH